MHSVLLVPCPGPGVCSVRLMQAAAEQSEGLLPVAELDQLDVAFATSSVKWGLQLALGGGGLEDMLYPGTVLGPWTRCGS